METTWVELRYENLPYVCFYCGILGHYERICVQRAKDVRSDTLKNNQFGAWLKAENPLVFSNKQRSERVHNTDGRTLVENHNSKLIEERRVPGTRKNLVHIDEEVDPTNTQTSIRKDNPHGVSK